VSKKICPIIKDECLGHGCEFYIHLMGRNPQTGLEEDKWGCAISFLPILLIENASTVRQVAASTDKVATEVRKHHETFIGMLSGTMQRSLNGKSKLNELDNSSTDQHSEI